MAYNHVYSPSTKAFYPTAIKDLYVAAGSWPNDAVPVTDETFAAYGLTAHPPGKTRGADANGQPIWVDLPPTIDAS